MFYFIGPSDTSPIDTETLKSLHTPQKHTPTRSSIVKTVNNDWEFKGQDNMSKNKLFFPKWMKVQDGSYFSTVVVYLVVYSQIH